MTKYEFVKENCEIITNDRGDCYISTLPLVGRKGYMTYGGPEWDKDGCIEMMVSYFDKIQLEEESQDNTAIKQILNIARWDELEEYEENLDEEERYIITPKGLFCMCLYDAGLIDHIFDERTDAAWDFFEELMNKCGYISEEKESDE